MSLFIGKDNSNKNIIHMTSDIRSAEVLKSGPLNTSILHSGSIVLEVVGIYTYTLTDTSGYKSFSNQSSVCNHMLANKIFLINGQHVTHTSNGGVWIGDLSTPLTHTAASTGIVPNSNGTLQIYYQAGVSSGISATSPLVLTITLIDYIKGSTIVNTTGGPIEISSNAVSIGVWDLDRSILSVGSSTNSNDKILTSSLPFECSYVIKNFSSYTGGFSFDTSTNTITKGGLPYIGNSAARMLIPQATLQYVVDSTSNVDIVIGNSNYVTTYNYAIVFCTSGAAKYSAILKIDSTESKCVVKGFSSYNGSGYASAAQVIVMDNVTGNITLSANPSGSTYDILFFY